MNQLRLVESRDKLRAHQVLSRKGVGMPVTGFAHSTKRTADLIKLVGGAPLIIKLLEGTQGKGVVLAETRKAAESVIDAFRNLKAHFLVQQFIAEAGASDLRCIVVGDKSSRLNEAHRKRRRVSFESASRWKRSSGKD